MQQMAAPAAQARTAPVRAALGWFARDVLAWAVATRVALLAVGLVVSAVAVKTHVPALPEGITHRSLAMWFGWDSAWYRDIAQMGYRYHWAEQSSVAFFPLYPLAMRAVATLMGGTDTARLLVAGLLVSNTALLGALAYLYRLVRLDYGQEAARRAVFYLLLFPSSLFLSAVFTESLALFCTVGAFYHCRRGQWWVGCALAGLASACRAPGVLLVAPLALEYMAQRKFAWRAVRWNALALALCPMGLLAYMAHLWSMFSDPLAFVHVEEGWGRRFTLPWDLASDLAHSGMVWHSADNSVLDLLFAVLLLAALVASWRRIRPSYWLLMALTALTISCSGKLMSLTRYELTLFPLFVVFALAGSRPWFDRLYTAVSPVLAGGLMAAFTLGFWVA